jgi:hypothetical protein
LQKKHALRELVRKKQGLRSLFFKQHEQVKNMKAFANHIFGACGPEVGVKAVESICREAMRRYFHMQEIEDEDEDDNELMSDVRADENNIDNHGDNAPEIDVEQ